MKDLKPFSFTRIIILIIVSLNFTSLLGQYYYYNITGEIFNLQIAKVNIYTGEVETIYDLIDNGYLYSNWARVDEYEQKLFIDSNRGLNYVMIDLENHNLKIDLSRDRQHPEVGWYSTRYHPTGKLYLYWAKFDQNAPEGTSGITRFAEVVDPNTGGIIKEFQPFFDISGSVFREDGLRIYGFENPTEEDYQAGIEDDYALIIDTQNEEIIERIPLKSLEPNSDWIDIADGIGNLVLISHFINNDGYMYVFNLDTKEKSKTISFSETALLRLSPDSKYIIIADIDDQHIYNGKFWVFDIDWSDNGEITPQDEGQILQLPSSTINNMLEPIITVKSAPEVFIYQAYYDSTKYLVRTKDAKLIRINHRPIAQTFSVFATNSIWLKDSVNVKSGYVGVNDISSGPFLNANVQLSIDNYAKTAKIEEAFANSIKVKNNAVVKGNVYTNSLVNNGKVKGTINNPFTFPVLNELPTFETATADTFDITVQQYENITLDPGNYGDLLVKEGGKVVFSGGIYNFNSIELKKYAKLRFAAASEVRVAGKLSTKPEVIIAPKTNAEITPADIVFYISGINGTNGGLDENPKAAKIGKDSKVKANFYVPNGTLHIKADSNAKGAFFGKDVIIGKRTIVKIDSAWELEF